MTPRPVARLGAPCYILSPDQHGVVTQSLDLLEYHYWKSGEADDAARIVGVCALGHHDSCDTDASNIEY
jgi:hypothetical protein